MDGFPEETCTAYSIGGNGEKTELGSIDLHFQPRGGGLARGMAARYPWAEEFAFYLDGLEPYGLKEGYLIERADGRTLAISGIENWEAVFDYTGIALGGER